MDRELLDEAYRKLKGSVYMDKTLPYIRLDIAEFENVNFDSKMAKILESINDEKKWKCFEDSVIDSVRAFTFPKKILIEKQENNKPLIISNVCSDSVCVEEYNNFIDISIEGHIIGVLWILLVGQKIDNGLYDNCFGNRLCDRLVFSNNRASESPSLFKPYYGQYETWRNQGLEFARKVVNEENQSVIITMLDLTRYFYNVDFNKKVFNTVTQVEKIKSEEKKRINSLVYKIMKRYSEVLGTKDSVLLPIGFLPSNILSNAYLKNFDVKVAKCKNVAYYGRYVDDMIIVTRIEPQSRIKSKIAKNGVQEVSNYMLRRLEEEQLINIEKDGTIGLVGYKGLSFKIKKFRFFYVDKNGYDTIIEKIKSDISHNTSEFNFLPEKLVFELDDNILHFEREDTVNKLRAVNGVSIDKYALSKAIGKNVKMSQYAEEKAVNIFIRNIEQLLNHQEIISNYTQWEGVLNYYVLNERWNKIVEFSSKIISALKELDEDSNKRGIYASLKEQNIFSVGNTLIRYYNACLARSLAIVWGVEVKKVIEQVYDLFKGLSEYDLFLHYFETTTFTRNRKYLCNSRMINRSLLPISIEECMSSFKPNDEAKKTICFYKLSEYLNSGDKCRYAKYFAKYAPYIISPFDILYTLLLKELKEKKTELYNDDYCVKQVCDGFAANFNNFDEGYLHKYLRSIVQDYDGDIKIDIETLEKKGGNGKYRIAVANVKMANKDIEDILKNRKRNISARCSEISKIVNEAIRNKTDILIFPEAYIPITYIPVMQAKAAAYNMTIIGGIEHIKRGNYVYNLTATLVPIVNSKARYTIPFFHAKVFYSPLEVQIINDSRCIPITGKGHTLFNWKGISFVTFCCYELTSIEERSKFKREADIVFGVEWNKDTSYFSNIMESLSRDRCCFCAQSNMSEYGDSRIVQPKSKAIMNIARVKGGVNATVIIDEIDVAALRKHKIKPDPADDYKPLPAGF